MKVFLAPLALLWAICYEVCNPSSYEKLANNCLTCLGRASQLFLVLGEASQLLRIIIYISVPLFWLLTLACALL